MSIEQLVLFLIQYLIKLSDGPLIHNNLSILCKQGTRIRVFLVAFLFVSSHTIPLLINHQRQPTLDTRTLIEDVCFVLT
jgi:hypothetical protein